MMQLEIRAMLKLMPRPTLQLILLAIGPSINMPRLERPNAIEFMKISPGMYFMKKFSKLKENE